MIWINSILWQIIFVEPTNSNLIDRTGRRTIGTTDPYGHVIYISKGLSYSLFKKVLAHEIGHCLLVSYDLLDDLHYMVKPECQIELEEWLCNVFPLYLNTVTTDPFLHHSYI